jgi:pimeloyl-ACP methyl ester carboxylesterase
MPFAIHPQQCWLQGRGGLRRSLRQCDNGRYRWYWDPASLPWHPASLLVRGEHSEVVRESGARAFVRLVQHAKVVVVPGMTHAGAGEEIVFATKAIVDIIRGIER